MSMTSSLAGAAPLSIYSILKGEHDEVAGMLSALANTPDRLEKSFRALFEKLRRELLSHSVAEHETVYSRLKTDDANMIEHAEAEHHKIEDLLNELENSDMASEEWKAKLLELKADVEQHAVEEEGPMFERMHRLISETEEKSIRKEYLDVKKQELKMLKQ